jgi:hypothetical protein
MRLLCCAFAVGTLLACGGSNDLTTESPSPLEGVWKLDSASPGVPPRTMTLTLRGTTISGTGSAMEVDVPILMAITGTYNGHFSPPLVELIFCAENGGGQTAHYTARLEGDRIVGSVVYYGITDVPLKGTLSFVRQQ